MTGRPTFLATFDIEDWFHAANMQGVVPGAGWEGLEARVERNTHELLDILAAVGARSTFFVLGWVARRYPGIVRRIVDEGHELASHTDMHKHLSSLPARELQEELLRSRESLEQAGATRVRGVRAPNFSVNDQVVERMAEAGYWYDSSYFSVGAHRAYGRLSGDLDPDGAVIQLRSGLLELPMSRLRLGRMALPWSGGAYFRLIPYRIFRAGVARRLSERGWFMFYLHPWELDDAERPPPGLSRPRRLRGYAGRSRMTDDLRRLLEEFGSARVDHTLRDLGFMPSA